MFRRIRIEADHQRLLLATAGAAAAHLLLFALGYWAIQQISIPSNESRTMVLTLQSTPMDAPRDSALDAEDTINDAPTGQMQSMSLQLQPGELSQQTSIPTPAPTAEIKPQEHQQSTDVATEAGELALEPVAAKLSPPTALAVADPAETPSLSDLPKPAIVIVESTEPLQATAELPLLTAQASVLLVAADPARPALQVERKISVSAKQKRMLDARIRKWASRVDASEILEESFSWQHKGQTYVAKFSRLPASGEMDLDEMVVEVTTEDDGKFLSTVMRLKKLAFSNFAQFVHRWDPGVAMHDDEMDGRFHSNSRISLDFDRHARPVFHGRVTTASFGVGFERFARRGTRKQIFKGGLETGVKKIRMPRPRLLFKESIDNKSPGIDGETAKIFDQDTRITFMPDGRFTSQAVDGDDTPQLNLIEDKPVYLLAAAGVTLHVSGTLKGKVLVYSPLRIVIEGDLSYSDQHSGDGDNILGLVSDHDVVVADAEVTGPGDLQIHASIYARHRFAVLDYNSAPAGTLHVFGSLSAGSMTATEPRYASRIVFDTRFESLRPPGFPVTDRYELVTPDYDWQVTLPTAPETAHERTPVPAS